MYTIISKTVYFFFLPIWCTLSIFINTSWGETREQYTLAPSYLEAPLNKVILVKKGNEIGAIKFTKSSEKNAEYIWYSPLRAGLNKQQSIENGKGYLSDKFISFTGGLSFKLGTTIITCGTLKLLWARGTSVSFKDVSGPGWSAKAGGFFNGPSPGGIAKIEMAPTKEEDINVVDVNAPNLTWYQYDEKRKITTISLDTLQPRDSRVRKKSRMKQVVK